MSKITVNQTLLDEINANTARELFKQARQALVDSIKVTVGDKVFDGGEISQTRMSNKLAVMSPGETTKWILADNSVHYPTKEELTEALRLAVAEQTRVWVMP